MYGKKGEGFTDEQNALKTVAFHLLKGSFVINEPYHQQHTYGYLLRFSSDPFPDGEGVPDILASATSLCP